jgi:DNA-binding PadR family transcriptional regulator
MAEKQWITAASAERDSRKKEYVITEAGRKVFLAELDRLRELLDNGENIMGGGEHAKYDMESIHGSRKRRGVAQQDVSERSCFHGL